MSVPVKQVIPINFGGGLDQKTDPWQVGPAEFLELNNMSFTTGGRLTKRNGFPQLGTTTINAPNPALTYSNVGAALTSARKVFSYNDELLINDAFNLYSYDAANSAWNYKGRSTMVGLSTNSIVSGATNWAECDSSVDTTSGIKLFAYSNGSTVSYSVQDTVTGQLLVNQAIFGTTYQYVRCLSIAGKSWVFAVNTSDGKLYYQAIVGQTPTGSPTALITTLNAAHRFYDVDVDTFSGNIYIAYFNATPGITIAELSTSLAVVSSISKAEDASHGISWFGDGTNIWVVYGNGSAVKSFIVNNAVTTTVLAPTVVDSGSTATGTNNVTGVWSSTQNKAFVFYDPVSQNGNLTVASAAINFNTLTVGGTAGTPTLFMGSVMINSKAFAISGIPHLVATYLYYSPISATTLQTIIQPTHFLLNLYNVTPTMGSASHNDVVANIAAKISPDEAGVVAPLIGRLAGVHQTLSGAWMLGLLQNSNYAFESAPYDPFASPSAVIDCEFDFSLTNPDVQSLGDNALIASGQVSMYDGSAVVEQNFHIYPNAGFGNIATTGGSMGSASSNALYSYIFTYEWIDNQGQVHRSFPSPVVTTLAAGQNYTFASGTTTGSILLTIPTLRVTNKPGSQVVINIYRTLANGSVYFLIGLSGGPVTTYGTVLNDPSVNTVTFTDIYGDSTIQGNVQLYTTGAQGYFAPPATKVLTTYKNRMIAVPFEGGFDFLYSNKVLPNFPVQFVPFFDQNIGTVAGPLVTLAGMDDKLVIFKSGKIAGPPVSYMVGQGPSPSGSGNDFTDPLPIALDVGCVDRASVVLTPVGIMFKSDKGIYLLDRGLNASYIGAQVEPYNQYSVLSAQLIPNTTQVRFLISSGIYLMYDYFYKKWSTFSNPAGISDCIFQGQHTYVSSAGVVYQEKPGTFVDGTNTPVLMNFRTSWLKLGGIQGYQRSYWYLLLGQYLSPHQLSVSTYSNFSATPDQTNVITPNSATFLENWRGFFKNQRCQSFQVSLQEVYTGTPGAGFTMSAINLYAGVKSSFRTFSAAETVG